jgi:hypothetical protein
MGAEHISLIFTANQDSCLWEMFYNDCSNWEMNLIIT